MKRKLCKVVPHGQLNVKHDWQLIVVVPCQLYRIRGWSFIFVVSLVILVCWSYTMEEGWGSPRLPGSSLGKWGLSIREAEQRIDAELFLDEYPSWELGAPHRSVILHEIFLHAAEWGQKEAERLICQGHWGSISRPDLEVDQFAMKLMGY